jgi:hypothetical protein
MEQGLADGQAALEEIQAKARDFLDSQKRKAALEDAIKQNDPKIQTAIDAVARKVRVTRMEGDKGEDTTFDKVLRYDAKTTERAIYLGESGKKKKRDATSDFVELSQPAEYSFVRFPDLVYFLEQVESPDRLMYVSKLQVTQKYLDPEYVQGKVTISTFVYKPQEKSNETSEEE